MALNLTPQPADPRFAQIRAIKQDLQALDELEAERPGLMKKLAELLAELRAEVRDDSSDESSRTSASCFVPQRVRACLDPYCGISRPVIIRLVDAEPPIHPAA